MAEETKIGIKMEEETKPLKKLCEKLEESISYEFNKGIENVDVMEMKEAIDMLKDLYEAKKYMLEGCYFKSVVETMEEYGEDEEMEDDERRGYRGQPRSQSGRFMSRGDGRRSNRGGRGRGRRGYDEMMMDNYDMDDMEYMRDMDRMGYGRMYFSGGSSSGSQGGSSGQSSGGSSGMSGGSQGSQSGSSSMGGNRGYSESRDSREGRSGQSRRGYMETKEMHKGNTEEDKKAKQKELDKWMTDIGSDVKELINDMSAEEKTMTKTKLMNLANSL